MSGGAKVRTFWFVDEDPRGKSLDEYQVMFGPSMDGDGFELLQCTQSGYFDEEAVMLVVERGDAVSVSDGNFHQAVLCRLVDETWLEEADDGALEGLEVVDIPERFVDVTLPEVDRMDENQMAPFNVSINIARSAEQEKGDGGKSIWSRLGEKVGRLF